MRGIISSSEHNVDVLRKHLDAYPGLVGRDIVRNVTGDAPFHWDTPVVDVLTGRPQTARCDYRVIAIDFGIKYNILRLLVSHGCRVKVVPAQTSAADILAEEPDGVFSATAPATPPRLRHTDRPRPPRQNPVFGICLGHQILALALAPKHTNSSSATAANHPVKNLQTGIEITSQNHGFCVDLDSLKDKTSASHT